MKLFKKVSFPEQTWRECIFDKIAKIKQIKRQLQFSIMWSNLINLAGFLIRLYFVITISDGDNYYQGDFSIFTDLDYKVYLDASLYDSPYERHTYRYSPLLAIIMSPSYGFHQLFGKIVIILFDAIACYYIPKLFENRKFKSANQNKKLSILATAYYSLNPLNIYISIRGNCEGIIMALLFAFFYYFFSDEVHGSMSAYQRRDRGLAQRQPDKVKRYVSYAIFGLAVHFRVFPIIFVPLLIMYEYHSVKQNKFKHAFKFAVQFGIVAGGVFLALAAYFYHLYGYDFLHQTYIYHISRRDNRHSHSAFFYEIYLNFENDSLNGPISRSVCRLLPRVIAFFATSFTLIKYHHFYLVFATLLFSFIQFNRVINLQYFLWIDIFVLISFNKLQAQLPAVKAILLAIAKVFGFHFFFIPTIVLWQIVLNNVVDLQSGYTLQSIWMVCLLTNFTHIFGFCLEVSKIEPYRGLQYIDAKKIKLPPRPLQISSTRPLSISSKKIN